MITHSFYFLLFPPPTGTITMLSLSPPTTHIPIIPGMNNEILSTQSTTTFGKSFVPLNYGRLLTTFSFFLQNGDTV